jgi:hypothetical protein
LKLCLPVSLPSSVSVPELSLRLLELVGLLLFLSFFSFDLWLGECLMGAELQPDDGDDVDDCVATTKDEDECCGGWEEPIVMMRWRIA